MTPEPVHVVTRTNPNTGPYGNDDGDVWVPRTVPYRVARRIAKTGFYEEGDRLVYVGTADARLLGFACSCEEVCELAGQCAACDHDHADDEECYREDCGCTRFDAGNSELCKVPAWHFRIVEAAP